MLSHMMINLYHLRAATREVPKGRGNSIGARVQALTLFKLRVPHENITAQIGVLRSGLYKLICNMSHFTVTIQRVAARRW